VQTVDRTVEILNTVHKSPSGLTLSQVSSRLGLPKTTVYRMLQALVKHDFLRKDNLTKVYRLGPALLSLAADSLNQWDLRSAALPHLRQLAHISNETVYLAVLHGDTAICLETIESDRSAQFFVKLGRKMDFHCAAAAKAILAFQSDAQIEAILEHTPLIAYTSHTITDVTELREHLQEIRRQGYALCDGELEVGVRAIAAPIIATDQQAVGSVAIVAPAERLDVEARRELLPALLHTARQISEQLGYHLELSTTEPSSP